MSTSKSLYFPNLDGLRAIAALAVIAAHLGARFQYPDTGFYAALQRFLTFNNSNGGRLGVIFFFVLSGFLITYLLYNEQEKNGKLNVPHFYARRILRIWPLYYLSLFIGFVVFPWLWQLQGAVHHENASWLWYALFAANFDHILHGYPTTGLLGVQWSVAVEEQFYLVWPLLFVLFSRKKFFPVLLLIIIALGEVFYTGRGANLRAGDYHFLACIRYLAAGGLLAFACYNKPVAVKRALQKISKPLTLVIYLVSISILLLQSAIMESFPAYRYCYHVVPVLFFVFVIAEQNFSENSFFKISALPLLTWLGKISYGLYLLHMVGITIVITLFSNSADYLLLKIALSLGLTILISYLSFTYFEKYFLSLKNKL